VFVLDLGMHGIWINAVLHVENYKTGIFCI